MTAAARVHRIEEIATVLLDQFETMRDIFASAEVDGKPLSKLAKTRLRVDDKAHDKRRHFAMTRDDGMVIYLAPQAIELDVLQVQAILAHEFGHAADFAYPGSWMWALKTGDSVVWVGARDEVRAAAWRRRHGRRPTAVSRSPRDDEALAAQWMKGWEKRTKDQVEWTADGIVEAVTGQRIGYCGDCMLQTFGSSCQTRPAGLR